MKKSTSFGYLINMLHISVTHMAASIYVAQSLVSKWKTGDRTLNEASAYYEKVLDYFLAANERGGKQDLEKLFHSLYGEQAVSDGEAMRGSLRQFLSGKDLSALAPHPDDILNKPVYTCSLAVFAGFQGRRDALSILLDAAEKAPAAEDLYILEHKHFMWTLESASGHFRKQLVSLLDRGMRLHLVHYMSFSDQRDADIVESFHGIIFHRNMREFYYPSYFEPDTIQSFYLLKDTLSVVGNNTHDDTMLYTSLYRDPLSIRYHEQTAQNIISNSTPIFIACDKEQIHHISEKLQRLRNSREITYCTCPIPGFVTMDEALFLEVLEENHISGTAKETCVELYSILRSTINGYISRHLYTLDGIRPALAKPWIPYYALSEIAGTPVSVTRQQFRRHLQCVIGLLDEVADFHVSLLPSFSWSGEDVSMWCKETAWMLSFDNQKMGVSKFCDAPGIVHYYSSLLQGFWNEIPPISKSKAHTRASLIRLLESSGPDHLQP